MSAWFLRQVYFIISALYCFMLSMVPLGCMEQQKVIIINGTTTAGKTTIAHWFKKSFPTVHAISADQFFIPELAKQLVLLRCNPFNILSSNESLIHSELIKNISKTTHIKICEEAKKIFDQGKIVVIDSVIYEQEIWDIYEEYFNDCKLVRVLVYCPLGELIQRVRERNKKTSITEQRSELQALDQFSKFYQILPSNDKNEGIDILQSINFVNGVCQDIAVSHAQAFNDIPFYLKIIQKAICPLTIEEIKTTMLSTVSAENGVTLLDVVPRFKHDYYINSLFDSADTWLKIIRSM